MYRFWDLVTAPLLDAIDPSRIVEVGSDHGFHTRLLLEFCKRRGGTVHVVDPLPKYDADEWKSEYGETLAFHESLSLDALPTIEKPDFVLLDGDHNWYTVFNELKCIEESSGEDFPLVLLHDVGWPYGRRDLYYAPETIPPEFRQPHEREGMERGRSNLIPGGGINTGFHNATHEGGKKNGVLTAVEDFVSQSEVPFGLFVLPVIFGLGVLVPKRLSKRNAAVEAIIRPFRKLEGGGTIRDDLLELVEAERIAVEKTRADAEARYRKQLASQLASQKEHYDKLLRREEIRTQHLLRWMLLLNERFSEVLSSRQWRAGQVIKGAYGKVARRPEGPSSAREMTDILREFSDWRARNEVKRKPGLATEDFGERPDKNSSKQR